MCAQDEFALGQERAKVLRLARELRILRGVSQDQVLSAVMATRLYKQIGEPALLEQAKSQPPKPRRETSTAPPAPWHKRTNHQTEEVNDQ